MRNSDSVSHRVSPVANQHCCHSQQVCCARLSCLTFTLLVYVSSEVCMRQTTRARVPAAPSQDCITCHGSAKTISERHVGCAGTRVILLADFALMPSHLPTPPNSIGPTGSRSSRRRSGMLIRHVFILGLTVCLKNCYGRTAREWQVCVLTVVVTWKSFKAISTDL